MVSQMSFCRETIGGVINYWLFTQVIRIGFSEKKCGIFCEFSALWPLLGIERFKMA